jgi:exodeoxyribonuclease VII small subunit
VPKPTPSNPDHPPEGDAPAAPDLDAIAKLSYEDAIDRLEHLIDRIESGEIGLEASVAAYEEGMALKAHCERIQNRAEQRVRELDDADDRSPDSAPSHPGSTADADRADDE